MNVYENNYEMAKRVAIRAIHKYLKKHDRFMKKYKDTGKLFYKYLGSYFKECAERVADSWKIVIVEYDSFRIETRNRD